MNINENKKRYRSFNSSSSDLDTSSNRTPKKPKSTKHLTRKEKKQEKKMMADSIQFTLKRHHYYLYTFFKHNSFI